MKYLLAGPCVMLFLIMTGESAAAFDFNDGTNQGWRRAGFFDHFSLDPIPGSFVDEEAPWSNACDAPDVPPGSSAPPGHGAIVLDIDGMAPLSPTGNDSVHWDFILPDLESDPVWGSPTRFRYSVLGDISASGGAFNTVQMIWHVIKHDGTESYFMEIDDNQVPVFRYVVHNATEWQHFIVENLPDVATILDINFRVHFGAGYPYTGFIAIDDVFALPNLQADFDGNGIVDGDDFLIWQAGFGVDDGGDADGDLDTDGDDFLIWQTEFGSGNGSASAAVPEPTSAVLLAAALVGAGFVKRRR